EAFEIPKSTFGSSTDSSGQTTSKGFEQWQANMRRCTRDEREALFDRGRAKRDVQRLDGHLKDLESVIKQKEEGNSDVTEDKELAESIKHRIAFYNSHISRIDDYLQGKGEHKNKGIKDKYKELTENNRNADIMHLSHEKGLKKRSDAPDNITDSSNLSPFKPPTGLGNGNGWNPNLGQGLNNGGYMFDNNLLEILLNALKEASSSTGS
ncbi:MAG TPA: hypothetical protein VEP90_12975, partial [Methylomirabilota bacterium]|nr:hypothetical protein [Methylomirabilota bacterium]